MKSLIEYIELQFEHATRLTNVYNTAESLSVPIIMHLAKIYAKFDILDTNKHVRDTAGWIIDIALLKLKKINRPKMSKLLFRQWLPDNIDKSTDELVHVAKNKLQQTNRYDDALIDNIDKVFHDKCIQFIKKLDTIDILNKNYVQSVINSIFIR